MTRLVVILSVLLAGALLLSLAIGPATLSPGELWRAYTGADAGTAALIAVEIRLPRTLLAAMIGATLGLSGAALQGYLRNPLAEPGLIGVSSSAALGAVLVFYFGAAAQFALALPLGGIAGALAAVLVIRLLAGRTGGAMALILAGIAVNSFAGALTVFALNMAPSPYALVEIFFWLLGGLTDRSLEHVWLAGPFMLAGWLLLGSVGRGLDALTLGEEGARSLGFNLAALQWRLVLGTALAVGAATAVAGVIGFVGLVVPHILRPWVGSKPGRLLLTSALGGAVLTVAADIFVRAVTPYNEVKLGVVTALVGAPFFLHLVLQWRRGRA